MVLRFINLLNDGSIVIQSLKLGFAKSPLDNRVKSKFEMLYFTDPDRNLFEAFSRCGNTCFLRLIIFSK